MSIFSKKSEEKCVGIFSIYDPAIPDCKFSPPFFSAADDLAKQAILETLRRKCKSFDALLKSEFLRMDLWHIGTMRLSDAKLLCLPKYRYKVCNVGELLRSPSISAYMKSVTYESEE